ncbi:MAG: hypothetical protein K0S32_2977 [Bacteroidetes bacterium]|jgi:hypothetical protein|nr:hypothetical protein [Bacteroidota bacterium]
MASNILNKRAILLTGTIVPNSIFTNYNNPQTRLADYIKAIKFYRSRFPNDDIYFIENSEFDLNGDEAFQDLRRENYFEVIRFPKSDKFNEGKGYQEFEMVDKAVDILKEKYSSFIKITGRYIVENISRITRGKCKGLIVDLNKRQQYAQTYLLWFTTDFYLENIKGEYKNVNDEQGRHIEHVVYQKIKNKNLFSSCSLFKRTPLTSGTTGSYGISLKRNKLRVMTRNVERFFYNILGIPAFFY